ncbi:hypothetical protein EDC01DRAFT_241600 [Geopyxis carbonaria]|nr:hypothetical protein EDC01DRAFT_241600 [Geopyxis carbonaria]
MRTSGSLRNNGYNPPPNCFSVLPTSSYQSNQRYNHFLTSYHSTSCRVRHLKCDETRPVCRRCQRAGRECVRGYNVRFRYGTDLGDEESNTPATADAPGGRPAGGKGGEFRFESDQVWIATSGEECPYDT